jgi:hypothetical protein
MWYGIVDWIEVAQGMGLWAMTRISQTERLGEQVKLRLVKWLHYS